MVLGLVAWIAGSAWGTVAPPPAAQAQALLQIGQAHAGYVPTLNGTSPVFILLIGSGARPDENVDHSLADSIHLLALNPAKHKATILGLPRDSWVSIPGHSPNKINAAMVDGGPELLVQTVENLTGIKIDYWALTTFWGFQAMVDGVGGITVDVPFAMQDHFSRSDFQPGVQRFNGRDALAFARDRHSLPEGDFGRSENGGRLMLAALANFRKAFTKDPSRLLTWVASGLRNVDTNVPIDQVLSLAFTASSVNPKTVANIVAPGVTGSVGTISVVNLLPGDKTLYEDLKNDGLVSKKHLPSSPNAALLGGG